MDGLAGPGAAVGEEGGGGGGEVEEDVAQDDVGGGDEEAREGVVVRVGVERAWEGRRMVGAVEAGEVLEDDRRKGEVTGGGEVNGIGDCVV